MDKGYIKTCERNKLNQKLNSHFLFTPLIEILIEIERQLTKAMNMLKEPDMKRLNESFAALAKAHYQLISLLIPEVKPTKEEIEAIRKEEPLIPLEELKKKLT